MAQMGGKGTAITLLLVLVTITALFIAGHAVRNEKGEGISMEIYTFPTGTPSADVTLYPDRTNDINLGRVSGNVSVLNARAYIEGVANDDINGGFGRVRIPLHGDLRSLSIYSASMGTRAVVSKGEEGMDIVDPVNKDSVHIDVNAIEATSMGDRIAVLGEDWTFSIIDGESFEVVDQILLPYHLSGSGVGTTALVVSNGVLYAALSPEDSQNVHIYSYSSGKLSAIGNITLPAVSTSLDLGVYQGHIALLAGSKAEGADVFYIYNNGIEGHQRIATQTVSEIVCFAPAYPASDWYLAVMSKATGNATVYRWDTAVFTPYTNVYMGPHALDIGLGDLNGDNAPDLVTLDNKFGGANLRLTHSYGDGWDYGEMEEVTLGSMPDNLVMGDVDGDGDCDLWAFIKGESALAIAKNNGLGMFTYVESVGVGELPRYVETGDINNDGAVDIVTSDFGSESVTVLINRGNGCDYEPYHFKVGDQPRGLYVGDLNGNGSSDIAVANYRSYTLSIIKDPYLKIKALGPFEEDAHYSVGNEPRGIWGGDFNNDGMCDIATADKGSDTVTILYNNGNGDFNSKEWLYVGDYGHQPRGIMSGDFNQDGALDIALSLFKSNKLLIIYNSLGHGFTDLGNHTAQYEVGAGPRALTVSDLDNDGYPDVVTADAKDNTVTVLLNDGEGGLVRKGTYSVGGNPHCVRTGDMDGDGYEDIVTANENDHTTTVIYSAGLKFNRQETRLTGFKPRWCAVADVNGDLGPDILTASYAQNAVGIDLFAPTPTIHRPYEAGLNIGVFQGNNITSWGVKDITPYVYAEKGFLKVSLTVNRALTLRITLLSVKVRVEV